MGTTWENIVHNFGTIYKHKISNKKQTKTKVSISNPKYTEDLQSKTKQRIELLNLQIARLSEEREAKIVMLTEVVEDNNNPEAPINMAIL